jgi:hypothetical protein
MVEGMEGGAVSRQISVGEIEAAVAGGADSAAMEALVLKLMAVKRPPKGLDNPMIRGLAVKMFGMFLDNPKTVMVRAFGVSIQADELARIVRNMGREAARRYGVAA